MEMTNRQKQAMTTRRKLLYTVYELTRGKGYPILAIRGLRKKSGVSTGASYHHRPPREDLVAQGFISYDEDLSEFLNSYHEKDLVKTIRHIVLNLNQYIFDDGAQFVKELYISQLSIRDSYITKKGRSYCRAVLGFMRQTVDEGLITPPAQATGSGCSNISMDSEKIANFLLRIGRGAILDWCLYDYTYDLMERSAKDLGFILNQLTVGSL